MKIIDGCVGCFFAYLIFLFLLWLLYISFVMFFELCRWGFWIALAFIAYKGIQWAYEKYKTK